MLGVHCTYLRGWGQIRPVVVAVDLGEGKPMEVAYLDEHNPEAMILWLGPLVKQLGESVIVTDDLVIYQDVADKLELEHQVCQFHVSH